MSRHFRTYAHHPTYPLAMLRRIFLTALVLDRARAYLCIRPSGSEREVLFSVPATHTTAITSTLDSVARPRPHSPTHDSTAPPASWRIFSPTPVPWCIFSTTPASWLVLPQPSETSLTSCVATSATQTTDRTATATATPSSTPSGSATNEYERRKTMGAIPALWTVVGLTVTVFVSWLCWEIWRDVREMMWWEEDLKIQPLLQGGGVVHRPVYRRTN